MGEMQDQLNAGLKEWATEAKKARALRTGLALYQPDLKDQFDVMSLPDLEGHLFNTQMQAAKNAERIQQMEARGRLQHYAVQEQQGKAQLRQYDLAEQEQARLVKGDEAFGRVWQQLSRDAGQFNPETAAALALQDTEGMTPAHVNALSNLIEAQAKSRGRPPVDLSQYLGAGGGMAVDSLAVNASGDPTLTFRPVPPAPEPARVPEGYVPTGITTNAKGETSYTYGPKPKPTDGATAFQVNASEAAHQLMKFSETVGKYGNVEFLDPEGAAALGQLPYETAILYSKAVDPATAAREGEVAAAQKHLIPTGIKTRNSVTLAALESQKKELARRIIAMHELTASVPPNLPRSFAEKYLPPDFVKENMEGYNYAHESGPAAPPGESAAPPTAPGPKVYGSIEEAQKAGHKKGDVVIIIDPATGKRRRFQFE